MPGARPPLWLAGGIGVLALGVLPLLSGGARVAVLVAGAMVTLVAGVQLLKDEDDDNRREPPCPPGGRSSA